MKTNTLTNKLILTLSLLGSIAFTPTVHADKGMLTISTDPGGVKIYINGKHKGTSPKEKGKSFAIKLDEGEYTVTAYGKSYNPLWVNRGKKEEVFVGADSRQPLTMKLQWQLNPKLSLSQVQRMKELMAITDEYRSKSSRQYDFISQGDGTVVDKRTGLQWMRCSLGQTWTGSVCTGKSNQYSWQQANNQLITFAKNNDWRLPTRFELETLIFCRSGKDWGRIDESEYFWLKTCNMNDYKSLMEATRASSNTYMPVFLNSFIQAFPNKSGSEDYNDYWSSWSSAENDRFAWQVGFFYGDNSYRNKNRDGYVRLVRSIQ